MKCVHWWMIADPDGPTSDGECRNCGATREFSNEPVVVPGVGLPLFGSQRLDETLARIRA